MKTLNFALSVSNWMCWIFTAVLSYSVGYIRQETGAWGNGQSSSLSQTKQACLHIHAWNTWRQATIARGPSFPSIEKFDSNIAQRRVCVKYTGSHGTAWIHCGVPLIFPQCIHRYIHTILNLNTIVCIYKIPAGRWNISAIIKLVTYGLLCLLVMLYNDFSALQTYVSLLRW